MKFFALVPLFFAFSSVMASGLTRRHHNDIVQARQAKLRRDIDVDICASLDLDLTLPNILREGKPISVGHLDVALCVSIVEEFVKSNPVCQAASLLIGVDEVITIIIELIKGAGNKRQCSLPNHGHSKCSHDDLCSFDCQHGYQPYTAPGDSSPSQCTCPAPLSECNGQCGNFPNGCGSATPQRRNTRRAGPPSCPVGQQICGVPGSSGWDCVDVKTDRESCGACTTPSPFAPVSDIKGVDCTAIPHVDQVECNIGRCAVQSCKHDFVPSEDKTSCALQTLPGEKLPRDDVTNGTNFINMKKITKTGQGSGLKSLA